MNTNTDGRFIGGGIFLAWNMRVVDLLVGLVMTIGVVTMGYFGYMLYDTGSVWTETVSPTLIGGGSMEDAIAAFGEELVNQAKSVGYTVQ